MYFLVQQNIFRNITLNSYVNLSSRQINFHLFILTPLDFFSLSTNFKDLTYSLLYIYIYFLPNYKSNSILNSIRNILESAMEINSVFIKNVLVQIQSVLIKHEFSTCLQLVYNLFLKTNPIS